MLLWLRWRFNLMSTNQVWKIVIFGTQGDILYTYLHILLIIKTAKWNIRLLSLL
jgi:hypothetical protein